MDFTEDNINGWNDSLSVAGMPTEKIGQAIALIQMLHTNDPNLWNFENCDRLIAGLVQATVNNENIDEILINMAQAANAPVGSPTILKVERYRKTFLYLLAAGVSFATLQTMAPGVISFILDSTYALFKELLSSGIAEAGIKAASASPLSATNMAQAIAVSSTNLVTAAFYTCADIAKTCAIRGISATASVVSQNYADCLRYGTELLSFAVATRVVPPVVEKAAKAVKSAAEVASGSTDEKIAKWIDEGGPQKVQAAIAAAGATVVENTKRAIGQSINDIDEINQGMIDPDRAPNRFIGPTINDMINRALGDRVMASAEEYRTAIGQLIGDLSQIDFSLSPNDNENPGVLAIMQKYSIRWDENPGFRALIAVWKLATEKPEVIEETMSQPDLVSKKMVHPAALSLKRADTLETDRMAFPENINDPSATRYAVKSTEQIGPQRPFPSLKVESPVIDKLQKLLDRYNLLNRPFPKGSYFAGNTVYSVLSREREDVQQALLKVLEKEESRDPSILQLSPVEKKNAIKANKLRYLAAIENFLHPTINIEVSEEEMETDLGGSRRRGRKSRHYRKKRSTLKRRGLKRRHTRKGKKRRHTKKRR